MTSIEGPNDGAIHPDEIQKKEAEALLPSSLPNDPDAIAIKPKESTALPIEEIVSISPAPQPWIHQNKPRVIQTLKDSPSIINNTVSIGRGAAPTTISAGGALFSSLALPVALYSTYDLVKNWDNAKGWVEKSLNTASNLALYVVSAKGITAIISKTASLSAHAASGTAQAAAILGPAGAAIISIVSLSKGILDAREAHRMTEKIDRARTFSATVQGKAKVLMNLVTKTLTNARSVAILDSLRNFVFSIGWALVSVLAAGIIAAAAVTPVGWAAAGVLLAGLVISVGILAYRKRQTAEFQKSLANDIPDFFAQLPADIRKELATVNEKDKAEFLIKKFGLEEFTEEIQRIFIDAGITRTNS